MHIDPPRFVSHQQLDRKIALRKLHQKDFIEVEKVYEGCEQTKQSVQPQFISVLCFRIQPLIIG